MDIDMDNPNRPSILFTVLPREQTGSAWRFTVAVTLRVPPDSATASWASVFVNWPVTVGEIAPRLRIELSREPTSGVVAPARLVSKPDEKVWHSICGDSPAVRMRKTPPFEQVPVRSFPAAALRKELDAVYLRAVDRYQGTGALAHWRAAVDWMRCLEPFRWSRPPGAEEVPGRWRVPDGELYPLIPASDAEGTPGDNDELLKERDRYRLAARPSLVSKAAEDLLNKIHDNLRRHRADVRELTVQETAPEVSSSTKVVPTSCTVSSDALRLQLMTARVHNDVGYATDPDRARSLDWAEIVALARNHPRLLRPLGLVLDLEVSAGDAGTDSAENLTHARCFVEGSIGPTDTVAQESPWTVFDHGAGGRLTPRPHGRAPWIRDGALDLGYRFEGTDVPKFTVVGFDVPDAGLNLHGQSESAGGRHDASILTNGELQIIEATAGAEALLGVDVDGLHGRTLGELFGVREGDVDLSKVSSGEAGSEVTVSGRPVRARRLANGVRGAAYLWQLSPGAPLLSDEAARPAARRSEGLSVVVDNRAMDLKAEKNRAGDLFRQLTPLYAPDLVQGYLVDVWDPRTQRWYSLHRRDEVYTIGDAVLSFDDVEAPLRAAAARPTDRTESQAIASQEPQEDAITEELFTWRGWSLGVPASHHKKWSGYAGPATGDDGTPMDEAAHGVLGKFQVHPRSLIPLRFGNTYRFRVRLADLAGDPMHPPGESAALEPQASEAAHFHRYEPIGPPALLVHPKVSFDPPWTSADQLVVTRDRSDQRVLLPPRVNVQLAEAHDCFSETEPSVDWSMDCALLCPDGSFPTLRPEGAGKPGCPPSFNGSNGGVPVFKPLGRRDPLPRIPFYPDPLAVHLRYSVTAFGKNRFDSRDHPDRSFYGSRGWPFARPHYLRARAGAEFARELTDDALVITVPPAWSARVRLSCGPTADGLQQMAEWMAVQDPSPGARELALHGANPMLSTPIEVELVHPVPRPLTQPSLKIESVQSELGSGLRKLVTSWTADVKSTSTLTLAARWTDPVELPTSTSPSQMAEESRELIEYVSFEAPAEPDDGQGAVEASHVLADTRHRVVRYWLEARGRFDRFFPDLGDEDRILRSGEHVVNLPSTRRPAAPRIDHIVPTFQWSASGQKKFTSTRAGGGLRIFLEGGWYSSGPGELLGVVVFPSPADGSGPTALDEADEPAAAEPPPTLPEELEDLVTRWARDPTREVPAFSRAPSLANVRKTDKLVENVHLPGVPDHAVALGAYEPHFDKGRGAWCVDLQLAPPPSYGAFVRLALVRYQPCSKKEVEVSEVTLADFAQLVPDRWVTVERVESRAVRVTVQGTPAPPSYDTGAARNEIFIEVHRQTDTADPIRNLGEMGWVRDDEVDVSTEDVPNPDLGKVHDLLKRVIVRFPRGRAQRRLVVREYEVYRRDAPQVASDARAMRIIYADVLDIE
jgi:hypothetical protein